MDKVDFKFGEAEYFFNQMIHHQENSGIEFDYCLNAFISSARSVMWIVKSECKDDPILREWYENSNATEEEKELLKSFTDLRNESVKENSIRSSTVVSFEIPMDQLPKDLLAKFEDGKEKSFTVALSGDPNELEEKFGKPNQILTGQIVEVFRRVKGITELNILEHCKSYLNFLNKVVKKYHENKNLR